MLSASVQTQSEGQASLAATYRLELDIDDLRTRLTELPPEYSFQTEEGAWGTTIPNNAFESVLISDIEQLAQTEGIARYNVESTAVPVLPLNLTRIEDPKRDQTKDLGGMNIIGMQDATQDTNIANGNVRLTEGAWIDRGDQDALNVSQDFAQLNGLRVGDTVTFLGAQSTNEAQGITATIKGVFEVVHDIPTNMTGDTFRSENTVFSNLAFSQRVSGNEHDPLYAFATFEVADPNHYAEVGEALRNAGINWSRYALIDDAGTTERRAQNFEGLATITNLFLALVSACGLLLIILSLVFWAKSRKHEVGILLSLGCKRASIVAQMALEACTLALAGCLVSLALASPVANVLLAQIATQQIDQQIAATQADASSTAGTENTEVASFAGANVEITWQTAATTTAAIEIMVLVAIAITMVPAALRKPKHILTEME